jgi:hypothetical protein
MCLTNQQDFAPHLPVAVNNQAMQHQPKMAVQQGYSETIASTEVSLRAYLPAAPVVRPPATALSSGTICKKIWDYPLDHSDAQANRSAA